MHEAERSLFDLQRGRPLYVVTQPGSVNRPGTLIATVEGLRIGVIEQLKRWSSGALRLTVTHHRAQSMGLSTVGNSIDISLGLNKTANSDEILRLATAPGKHTGAVSNVRAASASEVGGLTLARLGRLIPAVVGVYVDPREFPEFSEALERGDILNVTTAQIQEMATNGKLEVTHVSDGPVPLEEAEDAHFMFFRESNGILEHVAILIGDRTRWVDPVPVRIHSACLTGDLFGSLRCDCGEQLRGSLEFFAAKGGGVLLYLAQEGRGIGLGNKLRAYALQQEGLDTVDADCTLGFGADERCYDSAVQMLRYLQVNRIQLLTNNPEKVRAVREAGIQVVDRKPLYGTLNRHNLKYVKAKVYRAGHWLGDMLSGAVAGNK